MKSPGSTWELLGKPALLRQVEVIGTTGGAVKCVDISWNAGGESESLDLS